MLARTFQVLSVATRVRIVELLKRAPRCVNALAKTLGITPAAVSQHLRLMRDADLVIADRQGFFVHYRINQATLHDWLQATTALLEIRASDQVEAAQADTSNALQEG